MSAWIASELSSHKQRYYFLYLTDISSLTTPRVSSSSSPLATHILYLLVIVSVNQRISTLCWYVLSLVHQLF